MLRYLIILSILNGFSNAAFPSGYKKCKFNDGQCMVETANKVLRESINGNPELGLPPLDPYSIDKFGIDQQGDRPVQIKFEFTNPKIRGYSTIKFQSIEGFTENIDNAKIEMKFTQDFFEIYGPYKANGRILILPMHGEGTANVTYSDLGGQIKMLTKKVVKDGKDYMQIEKFKFSFTVKRGFHYFANLFNGNKQLGDAFNKFIDENWKDLLVDIKPNYEKELAKMYKRILNEFFITTPYADLFEK